MTDSCFSKCNRQNDDSAVSQQETMEYMIKRRMTTKHRMSKTEDGGKALKALKESTEKGTRTLDMNGMNQL